MKYEICDDVIDSTMENSYIMYKAHMTHTGKSTKAMSHFKFNMILVKAFIKGYIPSILKNIVIVASFVPNPMKLHSST
jgi:hypothetical protein